MLPTFPEFKKIDIHDRAIVESYTSKYPPYSDFNFTSMWCWDVKNERMISDLNGNLVVRFTDYKTQEPFFSFIGINKPDQTANELMQYAQASYISPVLCLVPQITAESLSQNIFEIIEDRDNHDYIYSIVKMSTYDGNRLRSKRNLDNRFLRNYKSCTNILDLECVEVRNKIFDLFLRWAKNKGFESTDFKNEYDALSRLLLLPDKTAILFIGLYVEGKLEGIIANELIEGGYSMLHFEKANDNLVGVYAHLMQENAKILKSLGKDLLNYEQDLGLPGLRLGKRSFRQDYFLKKFIVKERVV